MEISLIRSQPDPRYASSRTLDTPSAGPYTALAGSLFSPAFSIVRGREGRFFMRIWSAYHTVITVIVKVPAFNEFSAFAAVFREKINEKHQENSPIM